jgi:hypothetical protein
LQDAITAITDSKEIQAIGGEGVEAGTLVGKLILPEFDNDNPKDIAKANYVSEDLVSLFGSAETTASASTSAAPKPTQAAYVERSKNLLTALQVPVLNSINIISFKNLVDSITANSHNGNIVTFLGLLYNSATPELQSVIEDSLLTGKLVGTDFTLDLYQDNGTTSFLLKDLGEKFKTLPSQLQIKLYQRWMLTEIMAAKLDSDMEGYLTKTYKAYGGTDNFNKEGFKTAMQAEITFVTNLLASSSTTPSSSENSALNSAIQGYLATIKRFLADPKTKIPHEMQTQIPETLVPENADIVNLTALFEVKTLEPQPLVTDPQSAAIAISQKVEEDIRTKRKELSIDQIVLPPGFQVKLEILKDLEKSSLSRPAASSFASAAPMEAGSVKLVSSPNLLGEPSVASRGSWSEYKTSRVPALLTATAAGGVVLVPSPIDGSLAIPTVGASLAGDQSLLASTPAAAPLTAPSPVPGKEEKKDIFLLGTSSPSPLAATPAVGEVSATPPPLGTTTLSSDTAATAISRPKPPDIVEIALKKAEETTPSLKAPKKRRQSLPNINEPEKMQRSVFGSTALNALTLAEKPAAAIEASATIASTFVGADQPTSMPPASSESTTTLPPFAPPLSPPSSPGTGKETKEKDIFSSRPTASSSTSATPAKGEVQATSAPPLEIHIDLSAPPASPPKTPSPTPETYLDLSSLFKTPLPALPVDVRAVFTPSAASSSTSAPKSETPAASSSSTFSQIPPAHFSATDTPPTPGPKSRLPLSSSTADSSIAKAAETAPLPLQIAEEEIALPEPVKNPEIQTMRVLGTRQSLKFELLEGEVTAISIAPFPHAEKQDSLDKIISTLYHAYSDYKANIQKLLPKQEAHRQEWIAAHKKGCLETIQISCKLFYDVSVLEDQISAVHFDLVKSFFADLPADFEPDAQAIFATLKRNLLLFSQTKLKNPDPQIRLAQNPWQQEAFQNLQMGLNDFFLATFRQYISQMGFDPNSFRVMIEGGQTKNMMLTFLELFNSQSAKITNQPNLLKFLNIILLTAIKYHDPKLNEAVANCLIPKKPELVHLPGLQGADISNFLILSSLFERHIHFSGNAIPSNDNFNLDNKLGIDSKEIRPVFAELEETLASFELETTPPVHALVPLPKDFETKVSRSLNFATNKRNRYLELETYFSRNFPEFDFQLILDNLSDPNNYEKVLTYLKTYLPEPHRILFLEMLYLGFILTKSPDSQFLKTAAMPSEIYQGLEITNDQDKFDRFSKMIQVMILPKKRGGIYGGSPFAAFQIPMLQKLYDAASSSGILFIHEPTGTGKSTLAQTIPFLSGIEDQPVILILPFAQTLDQKWQPLTTALNLRTRTNQTNCFYITIDQLTPEILTQIPATALKIVDDYRAPSFNERRADLLKLKTAVFLSATPSREYLLSEQEKEITINGTEETETQQKILEVTTQTANLERALQASTPISSTAPLTLTAQQTLIIRYDQPIVTWEHVKEILDANPLGVNVAMRWLAPNFDMLIQGQRYFFHKDNEGQYVHDIFEECEHNYLHENKSDVFQICCLYGQANSQGEDFGVFSADMSTEPASLIIKLAEADQPSSSELIQMKGRKRGREPQLILDCKKTPTALFSGAREKEEIQSKTEEYLRLQKEIQTEYSKTLQHALAAHFSSLHPSLELQGIISRFIATQGTLTADKLTAIFNQGRDFVLRQLETYLTQPQSDFEKLLLKLFFSTGNPGKKCDSFIKWVWDQLPDAHIDINLFSYSGFLNHHPFAADLINLFAGIAQTRSIPILNPQKTRFTETLFRNTPLTPIFLGMYLTGSIVTKDFIWQKRNFMGALENYYKQKQTEKLAQLKALQQEKPAVLEAPDISCLETRIAALKSALNDLQVNTDTLDQNFTLPPTTLALPRLPQKSKASSSSSSSSTAPPKASSSQSFSSSSAVYSPPASPREGSLPIVTLNIGALSTASSSTSPSAAASTSYPKTPPRSSSPPKFFTPQPIRTTSKLDTYSATVLPQAPRSAHGSRAISPPPGHRGAPDSYQALSQQRKSIQDLPPSSPPASTAASLRAISPLRQRKGLMPTQPWSPDYFQPPAPPVR